MRHKQGKVKKFVRLPRRKSKRVPGRAKRKLRVRYRRR